MDQGADLLVDSVIDPRWMSNGASSAGSGGRGRRGRGSADGSRYATHTGRTQLAVHRSQPSHEHLGVYSLITSGLRGGDHNVRVGYGYLYEGAPYEFIAPKDSVDVLARWLHACGDRDLRHAVLLRERSDASMGVHQRHVDDGRFSFNGGVRLDSFQPYYEEQGKAGQGPYQDSVTYPGFEFHTLNGFVPRLVCRLRHVWQGARRSSSLTGVIPTTPAR